MISLVPTRRPAPARLATLLGLLGLLGLLRLLRLLRLLGLLGRRSLDITVYRA